MSITVERVLAEHPSLASAKAAAEVALEQKAGDIIIIDISRVSIMADYFVVCTVRTDSHARAVCQEIAEKLENEGLTLYRRDGSDSSGWIVMDWGDIVVHIFRETERRFYDLEGLWGDAPVLRVEDPLD